MKVSTISIPAGSARNACGIFTGRIMLAGEQPSTGPGSAAVCPVKFSRSFAPPSKQRACAFKNPAFEARFRMVIVFAWIRIPERCGPTPLSWLPGFAPTGREETLSTRSSKSSDCNAGPAATRLSERIYGGPQTSSSQVPWANFSSDLVPATSSAPAMQAAICSKC
jgi:hypothetical protein